MSKFKVGDIVTGKYENHWVYGSKWKIKNVKSDKRPALGDCDLYEVEGVDGYNPNVGAIWTEDELELVKEEQNPMQQDTFKIKALVSKGTYIRSLINDIGNSLNTYATMTSLNRTKQGKVVINDAYKLDEIRNNNYKYYKIEEVLDYPIIKVSNDLEFKIKNGVKLKDDFDIKDRVIFVNMHNKLLGIYEKNDGKLQVWKNF